MSATAPKCCAYCGKPAHRKIEHVYNPHVSRREDQPMPPANTTKYDWDYLGPHTLLRRSFTDPSQWNSKEPRYINYVSVWNGTWELNVDPFCSQPCAVSFAIAAYNGGHRMVRKAA